MRALALLLFFGAACAAPSPAPTVTDARIFHDAQILTLDPERPTADSLRIEGGVITDVWTGGPPPDARGERVSLEGATILPGLVDAHLHLAGLGAAARQLDLLGTGSATEVAERVREATARTPPGTWIRGRGWDQNDWAEPEFPTRALLDEAAPDHPVWLTRVDGHAIWLNGAALRLAGVSAATRDPAGGEILRDGSGAPTGILVDNAIDLADDALPPPSPAQVRADVERGIERCLAAGLTGVHAMGVGPEELAALRALEKEGALPLRVTAYLSWRAELETGALRAAPDLEGPLHVVGVKLFADGALGSRGAALESPYSDRPDTRGLMLTEPEELARRAAAVHAAGWQLAIHGIGDRGNREALDAIAAAQGDDRSRRHRVEHAQVLRSEDLGRFAALGVVASMQPTHATSDMPWAEDRLGPDRLAGAYAWQSLRRAGALLALGSDAPIESHVPWVGIHAAVTRQSAAGEPDGGWRPHERLSLPEALEGFTVGPARASGDDRRGRIRPGVPADLTVIDRDPLDAAPADLLEVQTLRTVVGGVTVHPAG